MPPQVVIVGGGVMGAATACFLARDHGAAVTVLERDATYARASSALSASSIRVQFSQPVNIALSRWSLAFLRRVGDELAAGDDRSAIGLSTAGSGEGWFDGPALMHAFRRKAVACGARFVAAEATGFDTAGERVLAVRTADGARRRADAVVLAAGAWSAPLAAALGVDLPVRARKRDVFVFDAPAALPGCPLVIDPSGPWFRPEGRGFLCGAPPRDGDPDEPPLDAIDHGLFDEVIWPALAAAIAGAACDAPELAPLSPARVARGERLLERNVI